VGVSESDEGEQEEANADDEASSEAERFRKIVKTPRDSFIALARLLLAHGADVNVVAKCVLSETALVYAAMSADVEMVKELLANGADVQKGVPLAAMRMFELDYEKTRGLVLPARSKEQSAMLAWNDKTRAAREEIKQLLRAAGAKETEDDDGEQEETAAQTPEEAADEAFTSTIKRNDVKDLTRLINAYATHPLGAQVLPEALRTAVIFDRREMVKLLLTHGADPNGVKDKPLAHAVHGGDLEYVLMLLEAGADVNATDDRGRTVLDYAESHADAGEERRAIIEALKVYGARRTKQ
jgi:ankyrin repeat protein